MRVRLIRPRLIESEDKGGKRKLFIPDQMIGELWGLDVTRAGRTRALITWDHGIKADCGAGTKQWSSRPATEIDDTDCDIDDFVYDPM